jgi:hypothetical protein
LAKIKSLTLTSWDEAKTEPPLTITVADNFGNSPFSVAFFRGHHNVAKAILEIAQAQYSPEEKPKTRYRIGEKMESDYEDYESNDDDEDGPKIYGEIVDDQFTMENVGQVSMKVKSHTKPNQLLGRYFNPIEGSELRCRHHNIFDHVIWSNDLKGLKFLLDCAQDFSSVELDDEDDTTRFFTFPDISFKNAVEWGRTEILAEIIKRTGAGLPLGKLVQDSGIELVEKPRYYQGLTVYGKKR